MNPQTVMTDFEAAAMGAFQIVWPNMQNKGCFFHLAQNQRKKIVNSGLQELVKSDPAIDIQVRMIRAMTFVPLIDLNRVWKALMAVLDPRLNPLIEYFDTYYMGRLVGNRRRRARFPRELWNMFERTVNGQPRTNNSVEAYHRSLNTHFGVDHSTMWVACAKLQQYQQKLDSDYEELISKRHPQTTRPALKWLQAEERKLRCINDYHLLLNKIDYLRGVAHNLSL
jgi:hypothetical protein